MRHNLKAKKIGLPPGSLIHVGEQKVDRPGFSFFDYDPDQIDFDMDASLEQCLQLKNTSTVSWVNQNGIHDIDLMESIGQGFGINALALEDILDTGQRAKFENCGDYNLIILKMLSFSEELNQVVTEQVSFVQFDTYLLSFQERPGDVFEGVRGRLKRGNGRIRLRGTDYLLYALVDSLVDSYFHVLEKIHLKLALLEEELIDNPTQETNYRLHHFRRELNNLRGSMWPLRDVISAMRGDDNTMLQEETEVFMRDLYDHTLQVLDSIDAYRDDVVAMLELYLSSVSQRMNEVMQVLTIMASLFIPLTFIAGVYGMNFENMPELKLSWGYPVVWLVMLACTVGMLAYFKRKKWF
jgi:magnesium transporter